MNRIYALFLFLHRLVRAIIYGVMQQVVNLLNQFAISYRFIWQVLQEDQYNIRFKLTERIIIRVKHINLGRSQSKKQEINYQTTSQLCKHRNNFFLQLWNEEPYYSEICTSLFQLNSSEDAPEGEVKHQEKKVREQDIEQRKEERLSITPLVDFSKIDDLEQIISKDQKIHQKRYSQLKEESEQSKKEITNLNQTVRKMKQQLNRQEEAMKLMLEYIETK